MVEQGSDADSVKSFRSDDVIRVQSTQLLPEIFSTNLRNLFLRTVYGILALQYFCMVVFLATAYFV